MNKKEWYTDEDGTRREYLNDYEHAKLFGIWSGIILVLVLVAIVIIYFWTRI